MNETRKSPPTSDPVTWVRLTGPIVAGLLLTMAWLCVASVSASGSATTPGSRSSYAYDAALNASESTLSAPLDRAGSRAQTTARLVASIGKISAVRSNSIAADIAVSACFVAGTPVLLAGGGSKPIEEVKVGDSVVASDPGTGKVGARRVGRAYVHYKVPTCDVVVDGYTVATTAEHPFWVEGKGWTPVHLLLPGDRLVQPDGSVIVVDAVRSTGHTATVYNFEVEGLHDYYVRAGDHWLLVHNNCDGVLDQSIEIAKHSESRALAGDGTHYVRGVAPDKTAYVDGVLEGTVPNVEVKYGLENRRTAYWDSDEGAIIFADSDGGGTVFTPRNGYAAFQGANDRTSRKWADV